MLPSSSIDSDLYQAVLNQLPDAVVIVDPTGALLFDNAAARAMLPGGLAGLGGTGQATPYQILDANHQPLSQAHLPLRRLLDGHPLDQQKLVLAMTPPAPLRWISVSGHRCPALHYPEVTVLILRDISEAKCPVDSLQTQTLYDPLTGLPNRLLFIDRLGHVLARTAGPDRSRTALLLVGLDRFSHVNTVWGHAVGDALLAAVAARLLTRVQPQQTLARLGGDTFALLLEDMPTRSTAIDLAEALHQTISQPFDLDQRQLSLDASIGIALGNPSCAGADDWLADATTALEETKTRTDQRWQVFDRHLQAQPDLRLQTEIDLRQAMQRGELRLHYQPIVTINNQEICGFEALVRWQHPSRGLLLPKDFIDIAEATGLIIPLGWWVLAEACHQMQAWTTQYPAMADFTVSVNMSSKQFSQPNLVQEVQTIVQRTGFAATRLKIEITEGVLIDHSDSIIATLEQLKAMGIKLLVDDFGTGYSSLSYLHRFPFDCLKIDRSFIDNADQDFEKLEILQSVVRLAWNLGLDVVAEGIETHRHHAQLKALRCELGQGYLFSKPLPPAAVETMMTDKWAKLNGLNPLMPAIAPPQP